MSELTEPGVEQAVEQAVEQPVEPGVEQAVEPRDEQRAERRAKVRGILLLLGAAVLAAAAWLAFGAFSIEGLGQERGWPLWWLVGACIPAGTAVALMRHAVARRPILRDRLLWGFLVGGAISLAVGATLSGLLGLEDATGGSAWWVGIVEEGAKLVTVLAFTRWMLRTFRVGAMLGAAVGFGFSVGETAGYCFGQYLAGDTGWAEQLGFVVDRALIGGGVHALCSALLVGAVFAAWGKPSARRTITAVVVGLLMAAVRSMYDWLFVNDWFGLADAHAFEIADAVTIGMQLVLLASLVIVLRSARSPAERGE